MVAFSFVFSMARSAAGLACESAKTTSIFAPLSAGRSVVRASGTRAERSRASDFAGEGGHADGRGRVRSDPDRQSRGRAARDPVPQQARPPLAITHAPGCMLITSLLSHRMA